MTKFMRPSAFTRAKCPTSLIETGYAKSTRRAGTKRWSPSVRLGSITSTLHRTGVSWDACKAKQAAFFRQQLELAATRRLPVVVHQRGDGCWIDAVTIVNELGGEVRAQFHCYVGTWAEAAPVVARGHRISFTGIATYPKAPVVAACAQQAPAGTFMLETDAPYLPPVPHRGQLCEPAMVRATAEFIAARRGVSLESLAAETTAVASDFFRLA